MIEDRRRQRRNAGDNRRVDRRVAALADFLQFRSQLRPRRRPADPLETRAFGRLELQRLLDQFFLQEGCENLAGRRARDREDRARPGVGIDLVAAFLDMHQRRAVRSPHTHHRRKTGLRDEAAERRRRHMHRVETAHARDAESQRIGAEPITSRIGHPFGEALLAIADQISMRPRRSDTRLAGEVAQLDRLADGGEHPEDARPHLD
jgi:hypothetical protein